MKRCGRLGWMLSSSEMEEEADMDKERTGTMKKGRGRTGKDG